MRLIPPTVSVVDADLDKHPLSLFLSLSLRSAPSQTGGAVGRKFGAVGLDQTTLFSTANLRGMCAFCGWLIPKKEEKKSINMLPKSVFRLEEVGDSLKA